MKIICLIFVTVCLKIFDISVHVEFSTNLSYKPKLFYGPLLRAKVAKCGKMIHVSGLVYRNCISLVNATIVTRTYFL